MKKGFTLIELLVVIGIIGILAGITISSFRGGTESARAAKCISNMRNLAQGAIAYATRYWHFPAGGSYAYPKISKGKIKWYHGEDKPCRGWISWLCMNGEYDPARDDPVSLPNISACCGDEAASTFAITNGAVWKFIGRSREAYVCPEHLKLADKYKAKVRFSYVMNAYFGYDSGDGTMGSSRRTMSGISADRTLLFAELPFGVAGSSYDTANASKSGDAAYASGTSDKQLDCVLQYKAQNNGKNYNSAWNGTAEAIAFNHKAGKKGWCAHVAFADGHTEKLALPGGGGGLSANVLTALLCEGVAVKFDGSSYSMPEDADKQHQ